MRNPITRIMLWASKTDTGLVAHGVSVGRKDTAQSWGPELDPVPSWPSMFEPQHRAVPSPSCPERIDVESFRTVPEGEPGPGSGASGAGVDTGGAGRVGSV